MMRLKLYNLLFFAITVPTMIAVLSLINTIIPYEEAPRIETIANGAKVYVLQSLREAILWPAGIVLFFSLVISFSIIIARRQNTDIGIEISSFRLCVGRVVVVCIALAFGAVIFCAVVVHPFLYYRKVTVDREKIVFSSLYWSWAISRSDMHKVRILREIRNEKDRQLTDLRFLATTKDEREFWSIPIHGLKLGDPMTKKFNVLLEDLEKNLRCRDDLRGKQKG